MDLAYPYYFLDVCMTSGWTNDTEWSEVNIAVVEGL